MAGNCSTSRLWVVVAIAFCITTVSLACYLIWKEVGSRKSIEERIVERYPTLFVTEVQQLRLFNLTGQYTPVKSKVLGKSNCTVRCAAKNGSFPARQISGPVLNHACCQSQAFFRDEATMTSVTGVLKTIAQFGNRKQFFKFEQCSHVSNYNYGVCSQNVEYTTAVTVNEDEDEDDDDRYQIEWVRLPGSCKCLNT
ncbi:uncharacterized protein LOC124131517 [Haliotis rufescens]|uniref:uncharacterized protein LOC124131517 n=1 Tax=Haliotis rufescens TaxID=6454 RepID=UPI00201EECA8|nr:uncharacterized protein LOC124131517 [Haliotis rufescens]